MQNFGAAFYQPIEDHMLSVRDAANFRT